MTPESVRDDYRRALARGGELVTVRRYTGSGASRPRVDAEVRARVTGYRPDELAPGIVQGDRKAIVLVDDLVRAQFALPMRKGDKLVVGGRELTVEDVDDRTRRFAGVLIAYELQVKG